MSQSQSQSQVSALQTQSPIESSIEELLSLSSQGRVNEILTANGVPAEQWEYVLRTIQALGSTAFSDRHKKALRILRDDGATYNIYSDTGVNRTWELDLVPSLINSEEWGAIESSLLERAELFDALLKDIYGPQDLIRQGIIPPEAIFGHASYLRACHGIKGAGEHDLILHAVDMVRGPDGELVVMSDRTQAPSGMGYSLENRTVMSRVFPSLFRNSHVHRLAPFFQQFRQTLTSLSATQGQPRVVLLTPGSYNESYFEHAHLASYLGFHLVQSGDLVVRNGFLWMKSLDGLKRVDVVLRRVDDWYCDPVELRRDSQLGVPNLLEVARAGNVVIANPLGSGILENPVLLKYLPAIGKALLGREPRMKSLETRWCADPEDLKFVLDNLDGQVIKPINRGGNFRSVLVDQLSKAEQAKLVAKIKMNPTQFVSQPYLRASLLPTFINDKLLPRPGILRTFAVADKSSYSLMTGGLTRVGVEEDSFSISSQVGAKSKDTWVLSSEPERHTELTAIDDMPDSTDGQLASLPSRVVENLFWVGRYAERAEASLRVLRTVFMMLNGDEPLSELSRTSLLQAVTVTTSTFPGFTQASVELVNKPEAELLSVVKDAHRVGSVHHSLNAMLSSAEESKELLSSDTLRVINDIRDALDGLELSLNNDLSSAPEEALDPLVTGLMALSGLFHESVERNVGWQFMEIGRRIERGIQTINLMEQLLTNVSADNEQETLMEALLLSLEALISYRRRYRVKMKVAKVLELVMMDMANPRSLIFQFDQLKQQISSLPGADLGSCELSQEERDVLEGETAIKLSKLNKLCGERDSSRPELVLHLQHLRNVLVRLSLTISGKYFEHRPEGHQLVPGEWEI